MDIGNIDTSLFNKAFPDVRRKTVIITGERIKHIKERHAEDYGLFIQYGKAIVTDPDMILKDANNERTILLLKAIPDTNLETVVRLSMNDDPHNNENTILSFHRINDRNAEKLINKSEVLYRK